MRIPVALIIAMTLPTASFAQPDEDAAHRADRIQTERLNRNAAAAVDRREGANEAALDRYREAQAAYQHAREEWRRRMVACQDGDERACDPD